MDNTQILIAALKQDRFMNELRAGLHGFQVHTIEPAFEGELIRALDSELFNPAVLIISRSICDTSLTAMIARVRRVSGAVIIIAADNGNSVDPDVRDDVFSVVELPQEARRMELIIKSAVQSFVSSAAEHTFGETQERKTV